MLTRNQVIDEVAFALHKVPIQSPPNPQALQTSERIVSLLEREIPGFDGVLHGTHEIRRRP